MQDQSDIQLLRSYADSGSEAAFRELVTRHTDFVFSAALRQVESPDLAADLAQSVFTDLARKARPVAEKMPLQSSLAGWLHRSTRYAALNYLRDTRRRQSNERQAMEQLLTNSGSAPDWETIRPVLDEALDSLADEDREALLLRYFKNQDFRAIGLALGTSDDTAQKRVTRAVDRLREFFSQRHVTIGASGFAVLISAKAMQAAPVGLAATISTTALADTAASAVTVVAATKTIAMTTLQKVLITAALTVAAGIAIYQAQVTTRLRDQIQTLISQRTALTGQLEQFQRDYAALTNRLAGNDPQQLRKEHLELLSLRGRATRLANELKQRKAATTAFNDSPNPRSEEKSDDSIILTTSLATNVVASGNTFIVGGWSLLERRSYLLITPAIASRDFDSEGRKINIQGQIIQAPESFWNDIGWGTYKSGAHRSTLAGELTPVQVELLLQALRATKDAEISATPAETIPEGTRRGYGLSRQEDHETGGVLMGVDFYPRISADGHSVSIEIIPTPVPSNVPIHPTLQAKVQSPTPP